jgi:hypothetical protein
MVSQATLQVKIGERVLKRSATYFGLVIEVIDQMPNCTLVRYGDRAFVVNTEDLLSGTLEETYLIAS